MLTELACRKAQAAAKAYKLADSAGLYLYITPTGFKSWRLKYRIGSTEKRLIVGSYPDVTLREARDLRDEARRLVRDGRDPSIERKKAKASRVVGSARTLQRFAEGWHEARSSTWRPHYAKAVLARLEKDVFPTLGAIPIGELTAPMVLGALRRIEKRGSLDVVRRVRQHLSDIFRVAIAVGAATFDPTAGLDRALQRRQRLRRPAVRSAAEARAVLTKVEEENVEPTTKLAMRLLALTAVRPAMVRLAEPTEFEDLNGPAPLWRISAAKMKLTAERRNDLGFEFVVPLAPPAVDVVRTAMTSFATKRLLLPGTRGTAMSDSTLSKVLREAGYRDTHVPHGWRATFSTVMNEIAAIENRVGDRDIIDLMLAHVPNDVEAAYNRYAYLPRRREIALEWAELLMRGMGPASGLIVPRTRGRPKGPRQRAAPAVACDGRLAGAGNPSADQRVHREANRQVTRARPKSSAR